MLVVSALSVEVVHTPAAHFNGSWTQRYAAGVSVTDLVPLADVGTTWTTVRFLVYPALGVAMDVTYLACESVPRRSRRRACPSA
ncbi:hypothetical protein FB00_19325 [Cellulosimicrobium funkei]|uniref:Uncharacterized protein n=1 Tax=Cellulosimicrobium funkei TaxID=264251 RepID=A0A0H2KMM0_9MICO|nr:hypothetical protein FB00_19325 [Cellulosimicrobium funkei]